MKILYGWRKTFCLHNLANISCSLRPSFIFFQDFLVWKLCSYCVIQSGWSLTPDFEFQVGFKVHFIKSHYQLATQFSSWSSSCWTTIKSCEFPDILFRYYLQFKIIEIIKMVEIHQKCLISKKQWRYINGKVKLHQLFLVFMLSFVKGSKIILKYVNCYVKNHRWLFLLLINEI